MYLKIALPILCFVVTWMACANEAGKEGNGEETAAVAVEATPEKSAEMALEAMMSSLAGRWQSEADPDYVVEFTGRSIRHLNGGQLTVENRLEHNANCSSPACAGDVPMNALCMLEVGSRDIQCLFVLKCDAGELQYAVAGTTGQLLRFKRVLKRG